MKHTLSVFNFARKITVTIVFKKNSILTFNLFDLVTDSKTHRHIESVKMNKIDRNLAASEKEMAGRQVDRY